MIDDKIEVDGSKFAEIPDHLKSTNFILEDVEPIWHKGIKKKNQTDKQGKQGYWENHYSGKLFSKGNYIDGKCVGLWEIYFDDGKLWFKGNYINGKKEGEWPEYSCKDGKLRFKDIYKDGKKIGEEPKRESNCYYIC